MSHTKGNLKFDHRKNSSGMYSTEIFDEDLETVATVAWYPVKTENGIATNREANARRLVACWNACEGIPTEKLEAGPLETVREIFSAAVYREQRDELLEALRSTVDWFECKETNRRTLLEVMKNAKAVLAKYPKEES